MSDTNRPIHSSMLVFVWVHFKSLWFEKFGIQTGRYGCEKVNLQEETTKNFLWRLLLSTVYTLQVECARKGQNIGQGRPVQDITEANKRFVSIEECTATASYHHWSMYDIYKGVSIKYTLMRPLETIIPKLFKWRHHKIREWIYRQWTMKSRSTR